MGRWGVAARDVQPGAGHEPTSSPDAAAPRLVITGLRPSGMTMTGRNVRLENGDEYPQPTLIEVATSSGFVRVQRHRTRIERVAGRVAITVFVDVTLPEGDAPGVTLDVPGLTISLQQPVRVTRDGSRIVIELYRCHPLTVRHPHP